MKLSKTAWNNVIIFSVMIIILLINTTNERLFPENNGISDKLLLPEHSVVLILKMTLSAKSEVVFERIGRSWQMTSRGILINLTNQQIEQLMFAWQQSSGLVQAGNMVIEGQAGIEVEIIIASEDQEHSFTLYPLVDQLLVFNHQKEIWLALPTALSQQLIPTT